MTDELLAATDEEQCAEARGQAITIMRERQAMYERLAKHGAQSAKAL